MGKNCVFLKPQQCIINVDKLGNQILQSWTVPKGRTCSSTNESGALILGHFQRGLKPRQALNVHWRIATKWRLEGQCVSGQLKCTRISTELPQTRILSYANSLVPKPLINLPFFEVTIASVTTRAHPERQRVYNVRFWMHPVTAVTQYSPQNTTLIWLLIFWPAAPFCLSSRREAAPLNKSSAALCYA